MPAIEGIRVLHHGKIAKFTLPGGKVYSYTRAISNEIEREAKFLAPVRTGRLRNSIEAGVVWANQHGTEWEVVAGSGHARYVSRGTRGKVMNPNGHPMRLYSSFPGGWMNTPYARYQNAPAWHVDGQLPNPYLQVALHAVLVQHRLI